MYISKKLQSTTNGCLERNKLGNGEATTKVSKCKEPDREHQEALYGEGVYLGWILGKQELIAVGEIYTKMQRLYWTVFIGGEMDNNEGESGRQGVPYLYSGIIILIYIAVCP